MKKRTDARSAWTSFDVDPLKRVTRKTYSDGGEAGYCYDGRIVDSSTNACQTQASGRTDYAVGALTGSYAKRLGGALIASTELADIDALGRALTSRHKIDTLDAKQFQYRYNVGGTLTGVQYPSQNWVTYGVTGANRVLNVRKGDSGTTYYLQSASYAAHGALASATLGANAFTETRVHNDRLQLKQVSAARSGQTLLGLTWVYSASYNPTTLEETGSDNNGNLRYEKVTYNGGTVFKTYGYDNANRLTAYGDDRSRSQSYGYDGFGNLWQSGASGVPALAATGPSWYLQTGGGVNNRFASRQYDLAGNLEDRSEAGGPLKIRYDAEGRVVRLEDTGPQPPAVLASYEYDADGHRVKRVASGTTTYYVYDAGGELMAEYGGPAPPGGTRYLVTDHLGSTRMVTDDQGGCQRGMDFAPYGGEMARPGESCGAEDAVAQKFTAKERDTETGLDYFGARYLSSAQGRFTSPDPGNASVHRINPQSWNAYAYVNNRPLSLIDPNGLEPVKAQAGTIHGFAQDMNRTQHKVGQARGAAAARALSSLADTKNFLPTNTVFNKSANWTCPQF